MAGRTTPGTFAPLVDTEAAQVRVSTGVFAPPECAGMTFDNVITGTAGNDEITVSGSTHDLIFGLGGNDKIDGGNGPDCIVGGEGDDELKGGNGDDVILGGPGNDEIEGGNGNDRLYGGDGDDEIEGEKGNDAIDGGPGRDDCEGGQGNDTTSNCEPAASGPEDGLEEAVMDPAETVRAFYLGLAERRFADAYVLFTPALQSSEDFAPFDVWVRGYDSTASITPVAVTIQEQDEQRVVVAVELESVDQDGVTHRFVGTWSLLRSNGQWLLADAQIILLDGAPD